MANIHILGIRHHGPGSARSVERALTEVQPDCILIEGPPELTDVLDLARNQDMHPPIAGFVYATDRPELASFDPFATFSPEWVALRFGLTQNPPQNVTIRFMDLPVAIDLALKAETIDFAKAQLGAAEEIPASVEIHSHSSDPEQSSGTDADPDEVAHSDSGVMSLATKARIDPIGLLAELAGAGDPEQWWEDVIEHQPAADHAKSSQSALQSFAAVMEAMTELRLAADSQTESAELSGPIHPAQNSLREQQREASMRQAIRQAEKDGYTTIVVVCGAWHAPVLQPHLFPSAASDAAILKGLPKIKVTATWTPWTHKLLARSSGYGAGITAPGWYHHVFAHSNQGTRRLVTSWLVGVARALRNEKHDASPASVIESVRLAETLASLRGRPLAGLAEVNDSAQTVLCAGSEARFALIRETILIDQRLGAVPDDTPQVPLAKDFVMITKQLRLKQSAVADTLELDLRTAGGLERSRLFHRLQLIGIDWAIPTQSQTRTTGTFKETWATEWKPELEIAFVEASRFGTTVMGAAAGAALEKSSTVALPELTELLDQVLRGAVANAIDGVLRALSTRAAESHDVSLLLDAVPPLARIARYGDVRKTDTDAVSTVLDGIVTRICAALPGATSQLDDEAADELRTRINAMHNAVGSLDDAQVRRQWNGALERIHLAARAHEGAVHGTVAGRACRLLRDGGLIDADDASATLSRVLSVGTDAAVGARWIEGFFAGGGLVLLHDVGLLDMVDDWMATVSGLTFDDVLPIVRRTFGSFANAERRMIGAAVVDRTATKSGPAGPEAGATDTIRGLQAVAPTVLLLLGVTL
jgi:Family of unknown function (DUF5682)